MQGWKWLFLIQDVVTSKYYGLEGYNFAHTTVVDVAVLAFFTLPNAPLDTRWLNPEERQLAHNRITRDTTEKREGTNVWKGLRKACFDYRL